MNERIVALDVGDRRIGIAVSDALGITAQPIETYTRVGYGPDVRRICQIAQQYETNRILCGLPLNMDGSRGFQAEKVAQLAEKLEEAGLVVSYYDERMTTVLAEDALLEANMSRENRKKKVDMVAAVMILQSYLDAQAMQNAQTVEDGSEEDEAELDDVLEGRTDWSYHVFRLFDCRTVNSQCLGNQRHTSGQVFADECHGSNVGDDNTCLEWQLTFLNYLAAGLVCNDFLSTFWKAFKG